ncbi:MAG: proline dehydrogenase family protein [Firmicutes bacterium]|nr:proline dehydrogenase family protein [Bacillota bacterium]
MNRVARKTILSVAGNQVVTRFAKSYGMRLGARRFVAGDTLEQALAAVQALNRKSICVTLDLLGESVHSEEAARAAAASVREVLDGIKAAGVDSNVSVKLTQMGLDVSYDLCLENMRSILGRARELGNFVRVDMEDSAHVDVTLELYRQLRSEFENTGIVLQSYLYRTERDLQSLGDLAFNTRFVKGAYSEPASVAYPRKPDVDANYNRLVRLHLEAARYAAVATHDDAIIGATLELVKSHGLPKDQFEFQMLYGIRAGRQQELAGQGYKMRVYVPFGLEWYPYFTRRLAERPANVFFVMKNFFAK